jgi:hypothetical protein
MVSYPNQYPAALLRTTLDQHGKMVVLLEVLTRDLGKAPRLQQALTSIVVHLQHLKSL